METATLAGGCFWCLEAVFEHLKGVERVVSGYTGGHAPDPSYEAVCSDTTGHAEAVQVTFDPAVLSYRDLLGVFFSIHDPTTPNWQGSDTGSQYRSAIFWHSPRQQEDAEAAIAQLSDLGVWDSPIVTEVVALMTFYPAEEYHQGYFRRHPDRAYCALTIAPKVAKFRKAHFDRLKR